MSVTVHASVSTCAGSCSRLASSSVIAVVSFCRRVHSAGARCDELEVCVEAPFGPEGPGVASNGPLSLERVTLQVAKSIDVVRELDPRPG